MHSLRSKFHRPRRPSGRGIFVATTVSLAVAVPMLMSGAVPASAAPKPVKTVVWGDLYTEAVFTRVGARVTQIDIYKGEKNRGNINVVVVNPGWTRTEENVVLTATRNPGHYIWRAGSKKVVASAGKTWGGVVVHTSGSRGGFLIRTRLR